jgi:DNA-directed RNA polymerase specialized sigma24 family protein
MDPLKASLIKLRIFSGLSKAEAAKALGISARSADRYWNFARAWLINELRED